jgi:hypothetical protein
MRGIGWRLPDDLSLDEADEDEDDGEGDDVNDEEEAENDEMGTRR